jgi:LPXTG-motif cell wall-anchored protein
MNFFKILLMSIVICIISLSLLMDNGEANVKQNEINIKLLPSSSFINADNMAPGDEVSSSLKIYVDHDHAEDVLIKTRMQSGSTPYYNQLHLLVSMEGKVLYKGILSKFQDYKINQVNKNGKTLFFTISFPKESGNEFQSNKTNVAFDFFGSTTIIGDMQNNLPNTATNSFNYLVLGAILILLGLFGNLRGKRKMR